MATWKVAITLGFMSAALAAGCTVTSDDGDDDGEGGSGAESGESNGGSTSGSGGKGGSSGSGTSGSAGKGGSGGSGTGGSSGEGGEATSGTGGSTTEGGAGGEGPEDPEAECDPADGELPSTPYDTCEPVDGLEEDDCQVCIQSNCCDESKECYGYDPENVCGWGGEDGEGEIVCYQECIAEYVQENDVCDIEGEDACIAKCTTAACGQIGNRTMAMAACLWESCSEECFGTTMTGCGS